MKTIEKIKESGKFWGGNSKKIIISLLFFLSVIMDKVFLDDIIFGDDLFTSKIFWAMIITIGVILTKDLQNIFQNVLKNKLGVNAK